MAVALYGVVGWPHAEPGPIGLGEAVTLVFSNDDGAVLRVESSKPDPCAAGSDDRWRAVFNFAFPYARAVHGDDRSKYAAEARRVEQLGSNGPWETASIRVDDIATPFEVLAVDDGWWVAVGTTPDVTITLQSFGVPLEDVALVKLP